MNTKYLVNESTLVDIADAIREKTGKSSAMTPLEMPPEIRSISGGGGWIDPLIYYKENRPAEWPFIPLPSDMEDSESEYYVGGETCIYLLYKKFPGDTFITDKFLINSDSAVITVQKYADADTPIGNIETLVPVPTSTVYTVNFEYTNSDIDWLQYNYVIVKIVADTNTFSVFGYTEYRRSVNGYPLSNQYWRSALVEFSGTAPNLSVISFGNDTIPYAANVEFFSLGNNKLLNGNNLFRGCQNLQTTPYLNTSSMNSMLSMFTGCINLQTIPLLDTSKVTDMYGMFSDCHALQTIPLLDTSNVTNMISMFYGCYALQTIPLLDTSNVTSMSYMFQSCSSLQTIPQLDTSSVGVMISLFSGCFSLQSIPALDTSSVTTMSGMFYQCYSIQSIPALDTSSVTNMSSMFSGCLNLQTIPQFNTSSVTNMFQMFLNCHSLQTIPQLNTSSVTDMSYMFQSCYSLQSIPALDTSSVTTMLGMFSSCSSLQTIPQLDTSSVTNMSSMFPNCRSLQSIPALDTSSVTTMSSMFSNCACLRKIDISKWDLSSTSSSSSIFVNTSGLLSVIIREFGTGTAITANPFSSSCHFTGVIDPYNPTGAKDGYIYVPDDMVETLKTATNWSTYASQIKGISELPT